jgi:E1-E2 ATPase/Cation transporter/ATPase, N-terminus
VTQALDAQHSARQQLDLAAASALPSDAVLLDLDSSSDGLSSAEARARLERVGPNALRSHGAGAIAVLVGQLRNPFLLLLLATAVAAASFGERTDAIIIFLISGLSVGLGFVSEYRSARAVEALHSQLRHTIVALREGAAAVVDVTELVPGDVVRIGVGDVVPADLRLLEAEGLECDESVLTGESAPAEKNARTLAAAAATSLPPSFAAEPWRATFLRQPGAMRCSITLPVCVLRSARARSLLRWVSTGRSCPRLAQRSRCASDGARSSADVVGREPTFRGLTPSGQPLPAEVSRQRCHGAAAGRGCQRSRLATVLISRATMTEPNRNASSACRIAVRRTAFVVRLVSETW